ncbi:DNA cytosine methyltransferase [Amycolatopsis sp. NBC_01286]|uniref:DNA cytosine methyltransferase n=1 Tax=Amycolatopsis sp. NBC_01286 TaxID=2903560 RepID=UPI002E11B92F|nr:DNA cytosine methyltransferase [Amycolatopsis sp. NBC_01286]
MTTTAESDRREGNARRLAAHPRTTIPPDTSALRVLSIAHRDGDPGPRIGDRVDAGLDPLVPATLERIEAGLTRHADVLFAPNRGDVTPVDRSFVSVQRGGGSKRTAYLMDRPLNTVSAQGNHHSLVGTPAAPADRALLLAYYSNGGPARRLDQPIGTLTTHDRYALVGAGRPVEQCTLRMLAQEEIRDAMGFPRGYRLTGSDTAVKRGFGNAVPPNMAELLGCALVETLSGEPLEPAA